MRIANYPGGTVPPPRGDPRGLSPLMTDPTDGLPQENPYQAAVLDRARQG